jgi:hypothetical protein
MILAGLNQILTLLIPNEAIDPELGFNVKFSIFQYLFVGTVNEAFVIPSLAL